MNRTPLRRAAGPWRFFGLATVFTWLFWIPDALGKRGLLPDTVWTNLSFVGAFGPLVAAIVLVHRENGSQGVRALVKKGVDHRFGVTWWAITLLFFPLLIGGASAASIAVDGAVPPSDAEGLSPDTCGSWACSRRPQPRSWSSTAAPSSRCDPTLQREPLQALRLRVPGENREVVPEATPPSSRPTAFPGSWRRAGSLRRVEGEGEGFRDEAATGGFGNWGFPDPDGLHTHSLAEPIPVHDRERDDCSGHHAGHDPACSGDHERHPLLQ